jgi:hypothetical protein
MPLIIRKLPNKDLYKVYNKDTKKIYSSATTLENAKRQVALLKDIENKDNSNKNKILSPSLKKMESKNKILSNNKMPNSWVMYVKEYASKNGMSYRDALRDPKCKQGYKPCKKFIAGKGIIDESEFADQALLADAYNSNELGSNAGKKYISL